MLEVELHKNAQVLLDLYRHKFSHRYKTEPIIEPQKDFQLLKDLCRQHGLELMQELITHYVKSDDHWFIQKAHSLLVFRQNLNVVLTKLPKKINRTDHGSKTEVTFKQSCDKCFKHFDMVCTIAYIYDHDNPRLCPVCSAACSA